MAANSKHFGDVTRWIEQVIDSCTSSIQEAAVKRLIKLHSAKLKSENQADRLAWEIEKYLLDKLDEKEHQSNKPENNGNTN